MTATPLTDAPQHLHTQRACGNAVLSETGVGFPARLPAFGSPRTWCPALLPPTPTPVSTTNSGTSSGGRSLCKHLFVPRSHHHVSPAPLTHLFGGCRLREQVLGSYTGPHLSDSSEARRDVAPGSYIKTNKTDGSTAQGRYSQRWPRSESQLISPDTGSTDSNRKVNLILTPTHESGLVEKEPVARRGSCKMGGAVATLQGRKRGSGVQCLCDASPLVGQTAGAQTQTWAHSTPAHCRPEQTHCGNLRNEPIH